MLLSIDLFIEELQTPGEIVFHWGVFALANNTELEARAIAQKAMTIAGDICVYTNHHLTIEELKY